MEERERVRKSKMKNLFFLECETNMEINSNRKFCYNNRVLHAHITYITFKNIRKRKKQTFCKLKKSNENQ